MDRKLIFMGMAVLISMFASSTSHVWAADMSASESAAIQSADSEMGAVSKDMEQQTSEDSLDQSSPAVDEEGLITDDTGGTMLTQVTSKKTRTVVKETTTSKNPQVANAPQPQPKYIK